MAADKPADVKTRFNICSAFNQELAKEFMEFTQVLVENADKMVKKEVTVYINSEGGVLEYGLYPILNCFSILKSYGFTIKTCSVGMTASCAFILFIHGDRRFVTEFSILLSHQFSGSMRGKFHELQVEAAYNNYMHNKLVAMYKKQIPSMSDEQVNEFFLRPSDTYISPEDAISLGIAHELLS